MTFYCKITSPKIWAIGDFTDNATHDINMTIYSDPQMQNTVDISGYTITMRIIDPNFLGRMVQSTSVGLTGDNAGLLVWKPTQGSTLSTKGLFKLQPRFENSTEKLTAVGVNASNEIFVKQD